MFTTKQKSERDTFIRFMSWVIFTVTLVAEIIDIKLYPHQQFGFWDLVRFLLLPPALMGVWAFVWVIIDERKEKDRWI
jgi:hypothetical protein